VTPIKMGKKSNLQGMFMINNRNLSNNISSQAYYSENPVLCFFREQLIRTLTEENT
jgi:hypothetical protein